MEKMYVEVREVHVQTVAVMAETPDEAIAKVQEGEGDYITMEYSHTMDTETWGVTDENNEMLKYPACNEDLEEIGDGQDTD